MSRVTIGYVALCVLIVIVVVAYIILPKLSSVEYASEETQPSNASTTPRVAEAQTKTDTREVVAHVPLPEQTRAIYMTSCVLGTKDFRERLVKLIDETEINAVVIDIKDFSGSISFPPKNASWEYAWDAATCGTPDIKEFLKRLHEKNIFVIGRVTVFQDPLYTRLHPEEAVQTPSGATWKDHKGLSFVDVGSRVYWDHLIEFVTIAYNNGFDEINFDYVRYPSDGDMQNIVFPRSAQGQYGSDKQANLEAFFTYLHGALNESERFASMKHENTGRPKAIPYTSADLFGMTTTASDDMRIGQVQDRAAPYFDFIAPMVYPSHYPRGFNGIANPNDEPYAIVHHAMKNAVDRMTASTTRMEGFKHMRVGTTTPPVYTKPVYTAGHLRTWIQDFDYGGDYDAADVRTQIQASYDVGVHSYMIWAPSNIYTREALKTE